METALSVGSNSLFINGPCGQIEATLTLPKSFNEAKNVAVVCHPHSLHGGSMTNKVVHTTAKAFSDCSIPTLRFNFRGVGQSDGDYDEGNGEGDDLIACVNWMKERFPNCELLLAGFSFGAFVSLKHAPRLTPKALISIAPPVARFDLDACVKPNAPWLVVIGSEDELVALPAVEDWLDRQEGRSALRIMDGASHFFHGRLLDLRAVLLAFLSEKLEIACDE